MDGDNNSINVFIPCRKDPNPFLDEIIACSNHYFAFGDLNSYNDSYPIVLINWPEQLFNWKEPTTLELDDLQKKFELWKKTAKIIYVVHDLERHSGMTTNYKRLFNIVISQTDSFVHLGKYSMDLFKKEYQNKKHVCIYHPLYEKSFEVYDKLVARKKLGIQGDKVIFIAPGRIRNLKERQLIIKAFKKIRCNNKLLIVPNMFYKEFNVEFKGRTRLKKILDIKSIINRFYNFNFNSKHIFNYGFTSFNKLSLYMSAADIVIVPRLKILNSGNVFLAMTYKKLIVGPNQGNVGEQLQKFNFPSFIPNNNDSINLAFNEVLNLFKSNKYTYNVNELEKLSPKLITKQWDLFLSESVI